MILAKAAPRDMNARAAAVRLAAYYAALFSAVGVQLPFWPLWLADRGLSPGEIGMAVAATFLTKIVVNPLVGHWVDRHGRRRDIMVALSAAATLAWLAFAVVDGFWGILAVTVVAVGLWAGIMPIGETLALATAHHHKLDYGRVRLWGSVSFIAAAVGTGHLLTLFDPGIVLWLIAGALALTALACANLPDTRPPPAAMAERLPLAPLLRHPAFLLFLAAAALNQASHTVYYAFSTIHWKQAGISDDTIGLLWSEGVLAEIVLFAFSGWVVARLGPARLLFLATAAAVLRWAVLGSTTALPALAAAQILHAATFGCAHLGAMHFIQRAIPAGLTARAQGLFAAVAVGLVPGLMSPVTGRLYTLLEGHAFFVMSVVSVLAAGCGWALSRRWRGESL